jgi:AraC-like DNA-binding protein
MSIPSSDKQAAVTVVDITDPTCAGDGTRLIDLDAIQLQQSAFHARRIIVQTEIACVLFHSTNSRVRTRSRIGEGKIAYTLFGPHAEGAVNGIPVRPGLMLAIAPNVEINVVANSNWETTTFLLPPDFVRDQLVARQRGDEFSLPHGLEMLEVSISSAQKLFNWGKRLVETAAKEVSIFNEQNDGLLAIQCDLIEKLLETLGTAKGFQTSGSERTKQRQSIIVKIAENYAQSQNCTNIYVSDLCHVTGVCERTLEYAFKETMGLTPVAFLNRLRLHRVRHELRLATPKSTTIAKEALRWGFWHFGEFSHAYNECFGELPSETLLNTGSRNGPCCLV